MDIDQIAAQMRQWADARGGFHAPRDVLAILDDRDALAARLAEAEARAEHAESFCYRAAQAAGSAEFVCAETVPLRAERDALADLLSEAGDALRLYAPPDYAILAKIEAKLKLRGAAGAL